MTLLPTSSPFDALPAPPLLHEPTRWAVFLDVDGTLLDFHDDPAGVAVSPELFATVRDLHAVLDGALALVSGRGLDDLDRLFGDPGWAMAGLHGLQLRGSDGRRRDQPIDTAVRARLQQRAEAALATLDGVQLEDKGAAIALHCRRTPERFEAMRDAALELVEGLPGYELQAGNLVMEIKPSGMDKGKAVEQLLQSPPFASRTPVYLGDDLTDEHAFEAVRAAGGWAIRVGDRTPTAAQFTLPHTVAVQHWLQRVRETLMQGVTAHGPEPTGGTDQPS